MDYIDSKFHSRGRLLVECKKHLETLVPSPELFGFFDEKEQIGNSIVEQANLFEDLFEELDSSKLFSNFRNKQIVDTYEKRFDDLFEKRKWPLYLN